MKKVHSSVKAIAAAAVTVATIASFSAPVHADIVETAKKSCTDDAVAKGYTVNNVVTAEQTADGGAVVKLDLTKNSDGTKAPLTCTLGKDGKVAFGEAVTTTTETARNTAWPWLLLPLLGLPALLWWARGRNAEPVRTVSRDYVSASRFVPGERVDAIVRSTTDALNIHSGPGTSYNVTGTLNNGQRVTLSGRYDNNWAELASGGWIPTQYLEAARYVS
jgi:FAD/FMN-containing dehydrogenase